MTTTKSWGTKFLLTYQECKITLPKLASAITSNPVDRQSALWEIQSLIVRGVILSKDDGSRRGANVLSLSKHEDFSSYTPVKNNPKRRVSWSP